MRAMGCMLALTVMLSSAALAQTTDWPQPDPEDVSTLDGIMRAYYEVVSGPA